MSNQDRGWSENEHSVLYIITGDRPFTTSLSLCKDLYGDVIIKDSFHSAMQTKHHEAHRGFLCELQLCNTYIKSWVQINWILQLWWASVDAPCTSIRTKALHHKNGFFPSACVLFYVDYFHQYSLVFQMSWPLWGPTRQTKVRVWEYSVFKSFQCGLSTGHPKKLLWHTIYELCFVNSVTSFTGGLRFTCKHQTSKTTQCLLHWLVIAWLM